jgi:integrase
VKMGIHVREKKGHLYLDIYRDGKRQWVSTGLSIGSDRQGNKENRAAAEKIRQKMEYELALKENGIRDPQVGKIPLVDYARKQAEGRGTGDHVYRLIRHLEGYGADIFLKSIDAQWVEGFKKYLLTAPMPQRSKTKVNDPSRVISKQTADHMLQALGLVLKLAVRDRLITENPVEAIRGISVPEKIRDYLEVDELEALAGTPPPRGELGLEIRKAFLFAVLTGLRISDLRSLTWQGISRTKKCIQKPQGKTGKIVIIPLTDSALDIIKTGDTIPRYDAKVFPKLTETKTSTNAILLKWAAAAGVQKRIGWHTARRTNATLLLESGADIATIARILGHSGTRVTLKYAQSPDKVRREAVNGLPAISIE